MTVQLASRISRDLSRKFIKDPNLTVEVETHRPFYILGELNKPGKYPYCRCHDRRSRRGRR